MGLDFKERLLFGNKELIEKGNFELVADIFSADYVVHAGGKQYQGLLFVKRSLQQLRSAIENIKVVDVTIYLQQGEMVTWQRTLKGIHLTNMMGIPPSGQKVEWREMVVSRFDGNIIAEEWLVSELLGELLVKIPEGRGAKD